MIALCVATAQAACQPFYGGSCNPANTLPCCTGSVPSTCLRHDSICNGTTTQGYRCAVAGATAPILTFEGRGSSLSVRATGSDFTPVGRVDFNVHDGMIDVVSFFCLEDDNRTVSYDCTGTNKSLKPVSTLSPFGGQCMLLAAADSSTLFFPSFQALCSRRSSA